LDARATSLGDDPLVAGVLVQARDASDRHRAEAAARQHQAELAHVLRVGTVREMTAYLAHEVNQPLSAIVSYAKGCARRLRAGTGTPDELVGVLEEIAQQAVRANEIVRRMDTSVRKEGARSARVDLNDLVRQLVRSVDAEAREHAVSIQLAL